MPLINEKIKLLSCSEFRMFLKKLIKDKIEREWSTDFIDNMNLVMIRTMQDEDGYWEEDNTFQRWNGITQLLNTLVEQVCAIDSSCKDGFYLCTYNVTNEGRRSNQCQGRSIVSNLYGNGLIFPNNKLKFIELFSNDLIKPFLKFNTAASLTTAL